MSITSIFERVANQVASVAVSSVSVSEKVQDYLPLARAIAGGDADGVARLGLDMATQALFQPSSVMGGLTLKQARGIFDQAVATDYARKNLWHINISNLAGSQPYNFNLFATEVSYEHGVGGEAVALGSSHFDIPAGAEAVEMSVTTLDDSAGSIKHWFDGRFSKMARRDGTFGLPLDYLFRVDVMHAFAGEEAQGSGSAYVETFIMRPARIAHELSRRDDNLQELRMTFAQFDPFTALV